MTAAPADASDVVVVTTSVATADEARRIAAAIVDEGLAACAQITAIESHYRWNGAVQRDTEHRIDAKTTRAALPSLLARLAALHPYDLPEILVLPVIGGSPAYLDWVRGSVSAQKPYADPP